MSEGWEQHCNKSKVLSHLNQLKVQKQLRSVQQTSFLFSKVYLQMTHFLDSKFVFSRMTALQQTAWFILRAVHVCTPLNMSYYIQIRVHIPPWQLLSIRSIEEVVDPCVVGDKVLLVDDDRFGVRRAVDNPVGILGLLFPFDNWIGKREHRSRNENHTCGWEKLLQSDDGWLSLVFFGGLTFHHIITHVFINADWSDHSPYT